MEQREINDREWDNPENWSGPKPIRLYFSKRDTRLWVPKSIRAMGWTINFGHRYAGVALLVVMLVPYILIVAITVALSPNAVPK